MKDGRGTKKIYQVSTLQALAMGYTRGVVTVSELLSHSDTGLGTYEDVNGEMILTGKRCYRALENGDIEEVSGNTGIPFCASGAFRGETVFEIKDVANMEDLKKILDISIDERFSVNSMHIAEVTGYFRRILARSEAPYRSHHVTLKDMLSKTQKDFVFENISGTLVCVYFPDYMDGINAPGWHMHFISSDRKHGGHVFDIETGEAKVSMDRYTGIEIQFPDDPAYDIYSLKNASKDEIREVEQGKE